MPLNPLFFLRCSVFDVFGTPTSDRRRFSVALRDGRGHTLVLSPSPFVTLQLLPPMDSLLFRILLIFGFCGVAQSSLGEIVTLPQEAFRGLRVEYPVEARVRHLSGRGVVRVHIDTRTSVVQFAEMEKRTGHKILDDAAIHAFTGCYVRAGKISVARVPITFELTFPRSSKPHAQGLYEARPQNWIGSGLVVLNVDPKTGLVKSVDVLQSTGHGALDSAAIAAFKKWHFRPGTYTRVNVPVTFTTGGVRY